MSEYKRFIVFGFDQYYPSGGLRDVVESYDTIDEVISCIDGFEEDDYDEIQILDCLNMEIVDLPV